MIPVVAAADLQEKLLIVVALLSWVFCSITVVQSGAEVRASPDQRKWVRARRLDAIFVVPEALTAKGRRLRVRLIVFGAIFVVSVLFLASLLAKPKPSPAKTSSFVSFRHFHG